MRTQVLVVGGGTVGLTTALFLARHGVPALVVERGAGPNAHPRATGVGLRSAELLRELGLFEAVDRVAIDAAGASLGKISAETLVAADLPHRPMPAAPPAPGGAATPAHQGAGARHGADAELGPRRLRGTCPQNRLDAVLTEAAHDRDVRVDYGTELVSLTQDTDGVTAHLRGPDGSRTVSADYVVAADGARSAVRDLVGIGVAGPGALGAPHVNILFRADLSAITGGRHFVTCDLTTSRGPGMLVTIDGRGEWVLHVSYDPDAGERPTDFTDERCAELIRTAIGVPDLPVEVVSTLPWRIRAQVADRYRAGRVLLAGDAAHAVPPLGAFGMNTGIADAHNLAWKLALVLRGRAGEPLLDTYQAERRPVGERAVRQSMLRLADPRLHWDRGPALAAERARVGMLNAPVMDLGYRYDSAAIVDPCPELPSTEDIAVDLDGAPGALLPHLWVGDDVSTLDLAASRFGVLAGPGGAAWRAAADRVAAATGVEVACHLLDDRWPAAAGIAADGALLVRPDGFVAARFTAAGPDAADRLEAAFRRVLAADPVGAVPPAA